MNILILTYWSYNDALIQTYTLPYLKIISKKINGWQFLVTLEKSPLDYEDKEKIRIQLEAYKIKPIFLNYTPFGITMALKWGYYMLKLWITILLSHIQAIHCFALPAGAIGYILALSTRSKLIIDSYEPHAESMVENGTWNASNFSYKILHYLEKKQTQYASIFIAAAHGMKDYASQMFCVSISENRFFVKPACVDLELFNPSKYDRTKIRKELTLTDKIVCIYAGKLGGIYYENEVFEFIKYCEEHWGERFRFLFLTNTPQAEIVKFMHINSINPNTIIAKFVPHNEIAKYMAVADFGITPVKPVPTKKYCTPIKDGEYWAMGLPIVITKNISDDSEIIDRKKIGYVLEKMNKKEYENALKTIDNLLLKNKEDLVDKIRLVAIENRNFAIAEQIYSKIYTHEFTTL